MNNLTISELNEQFVADLAVDYIMDCFKYSYIDTAGDESSILDINIDSPRKGLIAFDNNIRDANAMTDITFYYRNQNGDIDIAFKISQLSQLFEFNFQVNNRLFIDLYELTDTINCKFNFFNPQSFVLRQFHRANFIPFTMDKLSTKFSDVLSFTQTAYNEYTNQIPLELRNSIKINPSNLVLDYKGKFYSNNNTGIVETTSIFNNEQLTIIPNIDYERAHQYNNEEYIIMSTFTIPILGKNIPEIEYEESRVQYLLLTDGLEGGLNPTRKFQAIKVDNFVTQFKNVITIWDNTQNYVVGDTVKSATNNKLYVCVLDHDGQDPVYRTPDGEIVNLDAGKYWFSYSDSKLGERKLLHANSSNFMNLFFKYYADDHVLIGAAELKDYGFPITWETSISDFGNTIVDQSGLVDGTTTTRKKFTINDDNTGRYPRMIKASNNDGGSGGLSIRNHAISNDIKFGLPRLQGHFRSVGASIEDLSGIFTRGNGDAIRDLDGGGSGGVDLDSYLIDANKRTEGIVQGNSSDRTRGNEIDYYTMIKIR